MRRTALIALGVAAALALYLRHEAVERARHEELMAALKRLVERPTIAPVALPSPFAGAGAVDSVTLDALAARVAARLPKPAATADENAPAPSEPTPATRVALSSARAQVSALLARGTLDREGSMALRQELAQVSPDEAHELRRQIAEAINL